MATAMPPAYHADVAPPTYEEVVKKIESLVGTNPTPRKYMDVAGQLTEEELGVIEANADAVPPIRDEDKETFADGAGQTITSDDESLEMVREMAQKAVNGAASIRLVFSELDRKIQAIDAIHHSNFAPTLERHKGTFDTLLSSSQRFATELSVYAEEFDDLILEIVADDSLSIERRIEIIEDYISTADDYETRATEIKDAFRGLGNDMNSLVSQFATWAADKEQELRDDIKQLEREIEDLIKKIDKLEKALIGMGVVTGVGVIGSVILLFTPLAFFGIIGGLISLGVGAATIAGLVVELRKAQREVEDKNAKIKEKSDQIEQIRLARLELTKLGEDQMKTFDENMEFIINFWHATAEDAFKVKEWLQKGAKNADIPKYMKSHLEKGVKVYVTMAIYLDIYAKGIRRLILRGY